MTRRILLMCWLCPPALMLIPAATVFMVYMAITAPNARWWFIGAAVICGAIDVVKVVLYRKLRALEAE